MHVTEFTRLFVAYKDREKEKQIEKYLSEKGFFKQIFGSSFWVCWRVLCGLVGLGGTTR